MGIVFGFPGGGRGGRGGTGTAPLTGELATAAAAAAAAPPPPPAEPPKPAAPPITPPATGPTNQGGSLVAWDPITQKERWRVPDGNTIGGGTVTTAGNLVFQVLPDGRFRAYSADKGEKLLEIQTGMRGGMGPPITYMIDGKQYVALAGGLGAIAGRGGAPPPPPSGTPSPAPVTPKLLTFVIDGNAPLPGSAK
jgi:quinohemoprotein ethanol dehydrogenase